MKRIISIVAAASMLFGAASCQREPIPGKEGDSKVTFNVVVPDETVATRSISDGKTVDQLVWEVYVDNKEVYSGVVNESTINPYTGGRQFVLEIGLVSNLKYDILFWAQKSGENNDKNNYYYTEDLRNVHINKNAVSNLEECDAFYGRIRNFETGENIATQNTVTLKRPFAQVNFASSPKDWEKAKPFVNVYTDGVEAGLRSKVVFSNVYKAFNVMEADVTGRTYSMTFEYNLSPASLDGNSYYNVDGNNYINHNGANYGWIAMNYVFAPKDGATIDKVTASFVHSKNTAETALVKEVVSVPFKQNYRTNILGEIFTGGNKFTVIVDPSFANPDYTLAEPLMLAFEHGGRITLNTDLDLPSPLVLTGNKELTLDLNGKKISTTRDMWNTNEGIWSMISVQDGAKLTIVDSKGNGSIEAKANDSYVFDVRGGAELNIEGGKYVGNISAVYVVEGTANIKGGHYSLIQLAEPSNGGDERFTLNCVDANYKNQTAKIFVTGGSFVNYNPANNLAEGANTNFVTAGTVSFVEADGKTTYTVSPVSE